MSIACHDSWLLNSKITMVCVVSCLIVISLGGCWPEVHRWWSLGKGRKLWIAYGLYPGWEGTAGFSTVCFSFFSFLLFSWCDISLHWLWKIFGRLGRLTLHITSRNMKAIVFIYIISPKYFHRFTSLGGMGKHFTISVVDEFRYMVYWHMNLCRLRVMIPDC